MSSLLLRGANINHQNKDGNTALHYAFARDTCVQRIYSYIHTIVWFRLHLGQLVFTDTNGTSDNSVSPHVNECNDHAEAEPSPAS